MAFEYDLETLFIKAFEDEKLQSRFFYELLKNDVFVIGETDNKDAVLEDGSEIKLISLQSDGDYFVPVFLSRKSMNYFLDGTKMEYLQVYGEDALETLKHGNIVINPGQNDSMILYADEIQGILSQGKN